MGTRILTGRTRIEREECEEEQKRCGGAGLVDAELLRSGNLLGAEKLEVHSKLKLTLG